jgi:general secretion pathway protein J
MASRYRIVARRRAAERGLTLIEILVSMSVLAMIAVLIYADFDSLAHARKVEGMRGDRARQARSAMLRISRELSGAFLSMHNPQNLALQTRMTAFVGQSSTPFDRLDFSAFAHRRVSANAHESDQAEIGYFASPDPSVDGKFDLVRREQTPADLEPKRGGVVNVLVEDVESFDVRFLDAETNQWIETWDTMQVTSQPNRLPIEVRVTLTLKNAPPGLDPVYTTKFGIPIRNPLSFGISQ